MDAGEARMYLQGEAERDLHEIETLIKLLSKDSGSKEKVLDVLEKLSRELYQAARNLQKNRNIPSKISANVQICYKDAVGIRDEIGRKILSDQSAAERAAVQKKLLNDLESVRKKVRSVENLLVQLEKEGRRSSQSMNT